MPQFVEIFAIALSLMVALLCPQPALSAVGSAELERHALAAPAVAEASVPALAAYLVSKVLSCMPGKTTGKIHLRIARLS